jgi:hypothetical protein
MSGNPKVTTGPNAHQSDPCDLGFLRSPTLIPGEDAKVYEDLSTAISDAMRPRDVMEALWVRDISYSQWNAERFRRFGADLIDRWYQSSRINRLGCADVDQNTDHDLAGIAGTHISALERFDRIATRSEARRNSAYRAIERHREGLGAEHSSSSEQARGKLSAIKTTMNKMNTSERHEF